MLQSSLISKLSETKKNDEKQSLHLQFKTKLETFPEAQGTQGIESIT